MRRVVIARAKGRCQLCGAPGCDVHHIMHQGPYPHMRYDLENVILLCKGCHLMDDRGYLVAAIKRHITEDAYYTLKRRAQVVINIDKAMIRLELKKQLRKYTDQYG